MHGLSEVYDSEQEAERATVKNDFPTAISNHERTVSLIDAVMTKVEAEQHVNNFNTIKSLQTLKDQVWKRIDQLKTFKANKEKVKQAQQLQQPQPLSPKGQLTGSNGQTGTRFNNQPLLVTLEEQQQLKAKETSVLNCMINKINMSLIKSLNVDIETNKIRFISQDKINELEHDLQLLNFKERSIVKHQQQTHGGDGGGREDELLQQLKDRKVVEEGLKVKNEVLKELNLVYYSELIANHEFLKDLINTIRNPTNGNLNSTGHSGAGSTLKTGPEGDKYVEDGQEDGKSRGEVEDLKQIIEELKLKVGTLERDRIVLENQIVKLKERWNGLVESARKRKELESHENTNSI